MAGVEINTDDQHIRIFIVRHGQTDHNVKKILQGHLDTSLNSTGENQANLVGQRLKDLKFDSMYSSDLTRCKNTANAILTNSSNPVDSIHFTNLLRERNMGIMEGKYLNDAIAYAEKEGKSFRDYGEDASLFVERIAKIINQILLENKKNKNVLVVSHGGTIRTFLKILQYKEDLVVYNTSITVVDFDRHDLNKFEIKVIGNTNHLGEGEFKVNDTRVR